MYIFCLSNFSGCKRGWIVFMYVNILSTAPSSPNFHNFWGTERKMAVFVAFFPSQPPGCHQMGCFLHLGAVHLFLFQVRGDGERQGCFFFCCCSAVAEPHSYHFYRIQRYWIVAVKFVCWYFLWLSKTLASLFSSLSSTPNVLLVLNDDILIGA